MHGQDPAESALKPTAALEAGNRSMRKTGGGVGKAGGKRALQPGRKPGVAAGEAVKVERRINHR